MSFWAFLDVCLLAAGVILVVFSQVFGMPNLMINFALSKNFLLSACTLPHSATFSALITRVQVV